jgi:hypothetical protein
MSPNDAIFVGTIRLAAAMAALPSVAAKPELATATRSV